MNKSKFCLYIIFADVNMLTKASLSPFNTSTSKTEISMKDMRRFFFSPVAL